MQIQATVKNIGALREGVSPKTGNAWKALEILIEWPDGEHYQRQTANLFGEHVDAFQAAGIRLGDTIQCDVQLTTDMSKSGFVHNSAILRNVRRV